MRRVLIVTDSLVQFAESRFSDEHRVHIVGVPLRAPEAPPAADLPADLPAVRAHFQNPAVAPLISAPAVQEFADLYRELIKESDAIISIHSSAAISETVANAQIASQYFLGRCEIQVIDSEMISIGLGLIVQAAVYAAEAGEELDEIVRIIRGMIPNLYAVFCLNDLHYLQRHSLVSLSQALLGNMLGIIPFLTLEEGKMIPMEKVRSRQQAVEKMIEFASEFTEVRHLGLLHGGGQSGGEARNVAARLAELYPGTPIGLTSYHAGLATYIGLNGLGLVVLEDPNHFD